VARILKAFVAGGATVVALLIIGGAAGTYWWSKHGRPFVESGRQAHIEGEQVGEETDDQGCLDETLARLKRSGRLAQAVGDSLFLKGCLSASEPTAGFCDRVPKGKDVANSARWRMTQCAGAGLSDPNCPRLFAQVQEYCESGLAALPGEGARTPAEPRH
jgi:hypothetical protein